jgi:hypothetical protein
MLRWEVRPVEFCPDEVRPHEIHVIEVHLSEVRLVEVWTNGRLFQPPSVPDIDPLLEEFEMLWLGH